MRRRRPWLDAATRPLGQLSQWTHALPSSDAPAASIDAVARCCLLLMAMTAIGPPRSTSWCRRCRKLTELLRTDVATVQLTVSLYLLGLAVAQLVMGPLSDRFGRRPVLLGGLGAHRVGALAGIAADTVEGLIVARILQALGASTGIVVGRAIIRDLFDRDRAASMIGLVATVMVVAPMFGPLIGGLLDTAFGWEAIFLLHRARPARWCWSGPRSRCRKRAA